MEFILDCGPDCQFLYDGLVCKFVVYSALCYKPAMQCMIEMNLLMLISGFMVVESCGNY